MMESEETSVTLVHCIYSSGSTVEFSDDDIRQLLEVSRKNNEKLEVTGMLLYENGSFFQILEGEPDVVKTLLAKLQKDLRHDKIKRIIFEEIEERSFADWTMGYANIQMKDLEKIDGLNDFFKSNNCYQSLDEGRAKTLLQAFKEGSWRSSIQ